MKPYPVICWDNLIGRDPGPEVSHSGDAPGHPFANISDWRDYTRCKSSDSGPLFVKLDAGPDAEIQADSIAIAGHTLAEEGVEGIVLQSSDNDADYHDCFPPAAPPGRGAFFRRFAARSHRYFNLVIPEYTGPPEIGVLFIGMAMVIPGYPDPGFDPDIREADLDQEISKTGRLLGTAARYVRREITARFGRLEPSFITSEWVPFFDAHRGKPFFFAWDPDGRPEECYLARLKDPRVEALYERSFRSLSLTLIGSAD